ncbi:hypothetical protein F4781DRAFT_440225 [Annulohypoxylon bovei var. microspora]|nr:hypothetical protein F4781DRAFT_440225 [Annulohypoxylon bovei var. microspora]
MPFRGAQTELMDAVNSYLSDNGTPVLERTYHVPQYVSGHPAYPTRPSNARAAVGPPSHGWPSASSTLSSQPSPTLDHIPTTVNGLNGLATTSPSPNAHYYRVEQERGQDAYEGEQISQYAILLGPHTRPAATRPAAAIQQQQNNNTVEEGYVPMGRWPTWYTRSILHPSIWSRQLEVTGISANYGGNIFLESNQSANIPEEFSTSLWLTNLPPDCTHQMLLSTIRRCGKIYASVINPPVHSTGRSAQGAPHWTAASKLVFFDRAGLDKLMAKSQAGDFSVGGYVPRLRMNRIKSAPRPAGPHCRVLHIEGPSCLVNEGYLGKFFQTKFKYELEIILTLGSHGSHTRQEWRFGSYRCQAESARQAINREKLRLNMDEAEQRLWSQVSVHFGVDPCA